jgi:GNAT superfamily N-acetyltransferase
MNKRIFSVEDESDLERCFPIIRELRPHLGLDEYKKIYRNAHVNDGYQTVAVEVQGQIIAAMGYRFISDFVRGKHLYIDDLICLESVRSRGLGAELLKYAEGIASKSDCKTLRLCTGIENERGVNFYDRNGWTKRAFAYTKKI